MTRLAFGTGLLAALFAALPADRADAQQADRFALMGDPRRPSSGDRSLQPPRVNPFQLREDAFGQPYDLFGIPLTGERAAARERGFSFSVRPQKGIRAVAKLRF